MMRPGDYFQYPEKEPFKEPGTYKEATRKNRFWVQIMRPDLPFKFAENKKLLSKPICWTNDPVNLSDVLDISVEEIREEQEKLLLQSLLRSIPAPPEFLEKYDIELAKTAIHLREKEKTALFTD